MTEVVFRASSLDGWSWLRDRDNPDVLAHLEAENAHTDTVLAPLAGLEDQLFNEMKGRVQETDLSAPARKGDWWYYLRVAEGQQYKIHCRRFDADRVLSQPEVAALAGEAGERVVLDENKLAGTGSTHFALGVGDLSPNQAIVAYAVDRSGSEQFTLRFRDIESGTDLDDVVDDLHYTSAWSTDNRTFFYVRTDEARRPYQVWRHTLGTAAADDVMVFKETDQRFNVQVGLTRSQRFILITCRSKRTSEVWYLPASSPDTSPRVVAVRRDGVEYAVEDAVVAGGPVWFILSNEDAATFALWSAPVSDMGLDHRRVVLPARPAVMLEAVDSYAGHVVVVERENGIRRLNVIRLSDLASHVIAQPEPVYTVSPTDSLEFESTTVRFSYSSLVTPACTVEYDLESRNRTVVKQVPVLGGYRPDRFQTARLWATAFDGTRVPISVVHRRDLVRSGETPCVLYGYGAYGMTVEPSFSPAFVSLLERGFVCAIAHVRGGGELGRSWYEAGKLRRKRNTFTDFIACAEHLFAEGYTSPDRLVIRSRSAGGLLMAAVINMRPDLCAGVVAEVPFVDCLNTMLDDTLPLTVTEWEEWGNPAGDPDDYRYIRSYSPYDNIRRVAYPAVLATAGFHDRRVGYWEPAKWVARLRERGIGDRPILLRTQLGAGHDGSSGRYRALRDEARIQAFIVHVVGAG